MTRSVGGVLLAFIVALTQTGIASAQGPAASAAPARTRTDALTEKIKARVQKIGLGKDVTIGLQRGGERYGAIKSIEDDRFVLYEVEMKQLLEISYVEVKNVERGYGHSRDLYGRRISPHKRLIGVVVLIGLAVVIVLSVPKT